MLGHTNQEISRSLKTLVTAVPLEKEVLLSNQQEQAFYQPEISAAQELHRLVSSIHQLEEEDALAIASTILNDIKNHSLQTYLLQSLAKQDLYTLDTDLTEYFSLNKPFEIAAFNYTLRHPHQQVLMMRRLLNNPLVDETLKGPVRNFLHKSRIKPEEFPAFQSAIYNLWEQYNNRMMAAKESDSVQTQVAYYAKLVDRLERFLVKYERIPKWNTNIDEEMQLLDEIEWVLMNQERNSFEPLSSYQAALKMTLDSAQPAYLTKEETVALFDEFVKTTRRIYPHSLRDQPSTDEIPFAQEEKLWDNLSYWRIKDSSITEGLVDVYRKYAIP